MWVDSRAFRALFVVHRGLAGCGKSDWMGIRDSKPLLITESTKIKRAPTLARSPLMHGYSTSKLIRRLITNAAVGIALLYLLDLGLGRGVPDLHSAIGAVKAQVAEVRGY